MNGTEFPSAKRSHREAEMEALPPGQSGASTADGVHENTRPVSLFLS